MKKKTNNTQRKPQSCVWSIRNSETKVVVDRLICHSVS